MDIQQRLAPASVNYSEGPYNKIKDDQQWIRIGEGCPWNCPWCYEKTEMITFELPEIERNKVGIMDMNLLAKPEAVNILHKLGSKRVDGKVVHYELLCGLDYRFLTDEISELLKEYRFHNIRLAWDWFFKDQKLIKDAVWKLIKVGYKPEEIMVFMICNHEISYVENLRKLDLCKIWGVKVADCYYDNQVGPKFIPLKWTLDEIYDFRRKCRKHNQMVRFKIDPQPSICQHSALKQTKRMSEP